jgi:hypothetical protein
LYFERGIEKHKIKCHSALGGAVELFKRQVFVTLGYSITTLAKGQQMKVEMLGILTLTSAKTLD